MKDLSIYRKDFPMLDNKMMAGHPLVYFDNAATTLKPKVVIDTILNYYQNETTNVERGDSLLSAIVTKKYEEVRNIVSNFINCNPNEVIYTYGTTDSLNLLVNGYFKKKLKKGDVIVTTIEEHASNILPWFELIKEKELEIRYIPLTSEGRVTKENLLKVMDDKVKVVTLAGVSNVYGYIVPIKELSEVAHQFGALISIDGAQAVPHFKLDVKALDIDFLSFSAHKICGPTAVGVLYGKKVLLEEMEPISLGGGSNARFNKEGEIIFKDIPERFEPGTRNIEGILAMGTAINYIMDIGIENIHHYEKELKNYLVNRLKELDNVIVYNETAETGIVTFNLKDIFSQDVGTYLSSKGIAIRSGLHCAKLLPEFIGAEGTIRASLYFYNTKEECDVLIEALKTCNLESTIDVFF